jgi:hypothetical protein
MISTSLRSLIFGTVVMAVLAAGCQGVKGWDTTPPQAPTALKAEAYFDFETGKIEIRLKWGENKETDLAGYDIYRARTSRGEELRQRNSGTTDGYGYEKMNDSPVSDTRYLDTKQIFNGRIYYYKISAVDTAENESEFSYPIRIRPGFYYQY